MGEGEGSLFNVKQLKRQRQLFVEIAVFITAQVFFPLNVTSAA